MAGIDPIVRGQAGVPGINIVQSGWRVNGAAGEPIGSVVEREPDAMIVRLDGPGDDRVRIPLRLIAEEDETAMLATLAADSTELDQVLPLDAAP